MSLRELINFICYHVIGVQYSFTLPVTNLCRLTTCMSTLSQIRFEIETVESEFNYCSNQPLIRLYTIYQKLIPRDCQAQPNLYWGRSYKNCKINTIYIFLFKKSSLQLRENKVQLMHAQKFDRCCQLSWTVLSLPFCVFKNCGSHPPCSLVCLYVFKTV